MKIFYLKDNQDYIVSKFEMPEDDIFSGFAYDCISWDGETKKPLDWKFHSEVYAKWDGCSHWRFYGEDYNVKEDKCNNEGVDSYYHICSSFEGFIRTMCFIWKLAGNYHKKENPSNDFTIEEYDLKIIDFMLKDYTILEV